MKAKISSVLGSLALLAAAFVASAPSQAATLGVDFSPDVTNYGASTWNLGWSFTANTNVSVVGLGNWFGGALFPQDQQVGLWDSGGNLLASTFVSNSSTQAGSAPWVFASITPVELTAGQTYVVGGQGGADYTGTVTSATFAPQISFITDLYTDNAGANSPLVEPTTSEGYTSADAGWFGGNIELGVAATPLPSTWTMLIAGFLGLGFLAYRGSKKGSAAIAAA
jgi:hypothetical protein